VRDQVSNPYSTTGKITVSYVKCTRYIKMLRYSYRVLWHLCHAMGANRLACSRHIFPSMR
jgi:hypothetical protein